MPLPGHCLGNKQGHPGYSFSFRSKEGLTAMWVAGPLSQASAVAGSLQLGAWQPLGPEPLSPSANIPALTVTSLLVVSLWSAFPLTLRTFRGSQAYGLILWGVKFWSWSKWNEIMKINGLFKQHHTTQEKRTFDHCIRCILKFHVDYAVFTVICVISPFHLFGSWKVERITALATFQ